MITAHFADAYAPVLDGVVKTVEWFHRQMRTELGPSYVITPAHPRAPRDEPGVLRYPSLPFRPPYRVGAPGLEPGLSRRLDALAPDIVHAYSPFTSASLAVSLARRRRVPFILSLMTRYPTWVELQYQRVPLFAGLFVVDPLRLARRLRGWHPGDLLTASPRGVRFCVEAMQHRIWHFATRAQKVLVLSESARRELEQCRPSWAVDQPAPSVEVLLHGIDLPRANPSVPLLRHQLSIPPTTLVLLYVGQLALEKELLFLVEALALLRAGGVDFRLVLVGEGPHRAEVERAAAARALTGWLHFHGPEHDRQRLANLYAQADLFTFPSLFETQGMVVMEAASEGVPTVSLEGAPGVSELLSHDETGFFSRRTPAAYATLLAQLAADVPRRRRVGLAARRCVVRTEDTTRRVIEIYREVRERFRLGSESSSTSGGSSKDSARRG